MFDTSHSLRSRLFGLYALGLLGFTMRRFGMPVAPAIIGVILGPLLVRRRRAHGAPDSDVSVREREPVG